VITVPVQYNGEYFRAANFLVKVDTSRGRCRVFDWRQVFRVQQHCQRFHNTYNLKLMRE
jgi:hypothetical protein